MTLTVSLIEKSRVESSYNEHAEIRASELRVNGRLTHVFLFAQELTTKREPTGSWWFAVFKVEIIAEKTIYEFSPNNDYVTFFQNISYEYAPPGIVLQLDAPGVRRLLLEYEISIDGERPRVYRSGGLLVVV